MNTTWTLKSILLFRHAITAGHCICGDNDNNDQGKQCLETKKRKIERVDQITDVNKIIAKFGSNNLEAPDMKTIVFDSAFVKYNEKKKPGSFYDIGVLESEDDEFYHSLDRNIGPICLPAEDKQPTKEDEIVTVGWGIQYSEVQVPHEEIQNLPENEKKDPTYSSCTTNALGPRMYSFKECSVEFLKRGGRRNINQWGCKIRKGNEKNDLPTNYDLEACKNYFVKAEKAAIDADERLSSTTHLKKLDKASKIKIVLINQKNFDEPTSCKKPRICPMECFREELFATHGWCKVKYADNDQEWGFCDTSCKFIRVTLCFLRHLYSYDTSDLYASLFLLFF